MAVKLVDAQPPRLFIINGSVQNSDGVVPKMQKAGEPAHEVPMPTPVLPIASSAMRLSDSAPKLRPEERLWHDFANCAASALGVSAGTRLGVVGNTATFSSFPKTDDGKPFPTPSGRQAA